MLNYITHIIRVIPARKKKQIRCLCTVYVPGG